MIICGDALTELRKLPDESVHCCITSPPYYGLRDYETAKWEGGDKSCPHIEETSVLEDSTSTLGWSAADGRHRRRIGANNSTISKRTIYKKICHKCGACRIDSQLGLEKTPEEYVGKLVEVFREVRRVLRKDGTLWLVIGDSYAGSGKGGNPEGFPWKGFVGNKNREKAAQASKLTTPSGFKPKDLIGIPWRVAFALQADGWWLRQDIIWAKPNPMPESVTDRCTKAHEYIFMFSKSGKPTLWTHRDRAGTRARPEPDYRWINQQTNIETAGEPRDWRETVYLDEGGEEKSLWKRINLWRGHDYYYDAEAIKENLAESTIADSRNETGRHTQGKNYSKYFNGGSPDNPGADKPSWYRAKTFVNQESERNRRSVWTITTKPFKEAHFATFPPDLVKPMILAGCPIGGTVLDPFFGAGTTGMVATELGRDYMGIELNPSYCKMATRRIAQVNYQPSLEMRP